MGSPLYDFLHESPLFSESGSEYRGITDDRLRRELEAYRDHALAEVPAPSRSGRGFQAFAGTARVPIEHLVRSALYVERYLLDDPLLGFGRPPRDVDRAYDESRGLDPNAVNRGSVAAAATYMKRLAPFVAGGYVDVLPISHVFEPPAQLPVYASPSGFADALPEDVLAWFHRRADVVSVRRDGTGYVTEPDLRVGRGIHVGFEGGDPLTGMIYELFEQRVVDYDEATRIMRLVQTLPDEPPTREVFDHWVFQSVNKTARVVFDQIATEVALAARVGASYLTPHGLAFDLLQRTQPQPEPLRVHTANTLLDLRVEALEGLSPADVMGVRRDGRAFAAFRMELERQLKDLRAEDDDERRRVKAENAVHEIVEVQRAEVDRAVRDARRAVGTSVAVAGCGLVAAVAGGPVTLTVAGLMTAAGAAIKATGDVFRHVDAVHERPAYVLWKLLGPPA